MVGFFPLAELNHPKDKSNSKRPKYFEVINHWSGVMRDCNKLLPHQSVGFFKIGL